MKTERGAVADAPPETSPLQGTDPGQRSAPTRPVPAARGVGLAPCARRRLWLWVVPRCPFCHGSHLHRGGSAGGLRRAGCGRGEYRVTAGRRWSR